jgi:hypothetical protein
MVFSPHTDDLGPHQTTILESANHKAGSMVTRIVFLIFKLLAIWISQGATVDAVSGAGVIGKRSHLEAVKVAGADILTGP